MRLRTTCAAILGLVLTAGLLSACSGGGYKVTAYFDDIGDLQTRGMVEVADVRVGSIGKIHLTKDFRAKVDLSINHGVRIPADSEAVLKDTSLLGEKFVQLVPPNNSDQGPFLKSGDVIKQTSRTPELEFLAQTAVDVLAAVNRSSVSAIVETNAEAFGGTGPQLGTLISDLNSISGTLASRTNQIGQVIDNLDRATQTLAAGSSDISNLLVNLSQATTLLAKDRQKAVDALAALTHLAKASNYSLNKYSADIDRQIKQIDVIGASLANASGEVGNLVDWLTKFAGIVPAGVSGPPGQPGYSNVYIWLVPSQFDVHTPPPPNK